MNIPKEWPTDVMIEVGANVISSEGFCHTWDKASKAAERIYRSMNEYAPTLSEPIGWLGFSPIDKTPEFCFHKPTDSVIRAWNFQQVYYAPQSKS